MNSSVLRGSGKFSSNPKPKAKTLTTRLLQNSYLPSQRPAADELPPIFNSKTFSSKVAAEIRPLTSKIGFDAVEYRLTRADGQIRACHIPHPAAYSNLVFTIEEHWSKIPNIFDNHRSYIRPRLHSDGRLIVMKYDAWLTKTLRSLKWKMNAKYVAHADVANFFPSVYTHSISWALVGTQEAKGSNRRKWFDDIDKAYQRTKRGETNGVLIGPATSNFATEIILGKIDEELGRKHYRFYRHVDDYRCYCEDREKAEAFLADLSRQLSKYKLVLNSRKSGVLALPAPDAEPWVMELRRISKTIGKKPKSGEISYFLNQVTQIAESYGQRNAYKYAASVLKNKRMSQNSKVTTFTHLLGLSQFSPNLISQLIKFLPNSSHCREHEIGGAIVDHLKETIRFRRSDSTAWLLYLAHRSGGKISDEIVDEIVAQEDCIPLLIVFAIGDDRQKSKVVKFAKQVISLPDPYDAHSHWLLIYELFRVGALKKCGKDQECFKIMQKHKVGFCTLL